MLVLSRFFHLLTIGLFVVFLVLSGCNAPQEPILRLGTNAWLGYEPLYLAKSKEFWSNKQVRLVEYLSSSETIRAFRNNEIDAVALTLDEILLLLKDGIDLKVVLVTDISLGGDAILGQPGIQTVSDLVGKRVAVESGALGAYLLTRAVELNGISLADVEVVHQTANEHAQTFENNIAEAVIGCEPEKSILLKKGATVIFDSSEIPGEIVDVIAVRHEYLKKNPAAVQALLVGWFEAVNFLQNKPIEAATIMSQRMQLSVDEVRDSLNGLKIPSYQENLKFLDGSSPTLITTAKKLNQVMLDNQLIDQQVKIEPLLFSQSLLDHGF